MHKSALQQSSGERKRIQTNPPVVGNKSGQSSSFSLHGLSGLRGSCGTCVDEDLPTWIDRAQRCGTSAGVTPGRELMRNVPVLFQTHLQKECTRVCNCNVMWRMHVCMGGGGMCSVCLDMSLDVRLTNYLTRTEFSICHATFSGDGNVLGSCESAYLVWRQCGAKPLVQEQCRNTTRAHSVEGASCSRRTHSQRGTHTASGRLAGRWAAAPGECQRAVGWGQPCSTPPLYADQSRRWE